MNRPSGFDIENDAQDTVLAETGLGYLPLRSLCRGRHTRVCREVSGLSSATYLMTTAELDTLLKLLRKHGVHGFEGLDIKVSFEPSGAGFLDVPNLDPEQLTGQEDDDEGTEVKFYSTPIAPRK